MSVHRAELRGVRRLWDRLTDGPRKYIFTFVGLAMAGVVGVAVAQWVVVPQGHGHAYGHGKNATTGLAPNTLDLSLSTFDTGLTPIGPGETAVMDATVANPNTFSVTLTGVTPQAAQPIEASDNGVPDPTCTAAPATFTITGWSGSKAIAAGSNSDVQLTLTTTATFPSCLAGRDFTLPVDLNATA
jgi:hypothetical protein